MRVVDRATFMAMPPGVVYRKSDTPDMNFGPLCVKSTTYEEDDTWYHTPLTVPRVEYGKYADMDNPAEHKALYIKMYETGESHPMSLDSGIDRAITPNAVFVVYDDADMRSFRAVIDAALDGWLSADCDEIAARLAKSHDRDELPDT